MIQSKDIKIAIGIAIATSTVLGVTYLLLPRRYKDKMADKVDQVVKKIKDKFKRNKQ
jgi:hypothetical protein